MSTLATLADTIYKPKKDQVRSILCGLYEQHPELGYDLAALYTYFMPAKPKKPKTDFDWLSAATDAESNRTFQRFVYANDKHAVATDGHRMHLMSLSDIHLDAGFYDRSRNLVERDDQYPDYQRVLPERNPQRECGADVFSELVEVAKSFAYRMEIGGLHCGFAKQYVDQALSIMQNPCVTLPDSANKAVRIDDDHHTAVIMPMRM